MASQYAQALEQQRRYARWLASPDGVRTFYDQMVDRTSLRWLQQTATLTLASADPYYWQPEMCDLLEAVSAEMPRWTLRREALPTDFGFCWFARPLALPHSFLRIEAVAWGLRSPVSQTPSGPAALETVVATVYACNPNDARGIVPMTTFWWPMGQAMDVEQDIPPSSTAEMARVNVRCWRFGAAIFALLEQRILVTTREGVARATRRRLVKDRARQPPAILVVRLRHALGTHAERGEPVEWSCRWLVRGHWRQQYYPSSGEYRPIFILPHIKGPDDKPLRAPAERVFAVVR